MTNNPKKADDATEAALSAIQDALGRIVDEERRGEQRAGATTGEQAEEYGREVPKLDVEIAGVDHRVESMFRSSTRSILTTNSLIEGLSQLALLELALVAGLVAAFGAHVTESWKIGFIALGALSLGFGAAVLMYRRLINSRMSNLETDYRELSNRAQILVRQVERFERQSNIERRAAAR
jgi:hypothetical protein